MRRDRSWPPVTPPGIFLLDPDTRSASEVDALRLARLSGDPDTLCYVLIRRITNGFDIGNADERLAALEEFNRLSQSHATLTERACGYLVEITTQLELGRLDDAERTLGRLRTDTADVHDRYIKTMARVPETTALMARGHLDRIEELAVEMERDAPMSPSRPPPSEQSVIDYVATGRRCCR